MKVTAPRALLPPNPEGFGFSPRRTSRGERQRGEGITSTTPTSRRRCPQASPLSWPAEPTLDFSRPHVSPTPATDAPPGTWGGRRSDLTGVERVGAEASDSGRAPPRPPRPTATTRHRLATRAAKGDGQHQRRPLAEVDVAPPPEAAAPAPKPPAQDRTDRSSPPPSTTDARRSGDPLRWWRGRGEWGRGGRRRARVSNARVAPAGVTQGPRRNGWILKKGP